MRIIVPGHHDPMIWDIHQCQASSLLDQQEVHGHVCNNDKSSAEYCQANHIFPHSEVVKSEGRQDRGTWYLDVETVTVIFEAQTSDFINNQSFVAIVKD
jgi:hypothetical protein